MGGDANAWLAHAKEVLRIRRSTRTEGEDKSRMGLFATRIDPATGRPRSQSQQMRARGRVQDAEAGAAIAPAEALYQQRVRSAAQAAQRIQSRRNAGSN
jgi:hypothetical protein